MCTGFIRCSPRATRGGVAFVLTLVLQLGLTAGAAAGALPDLRWLDCVGATNRLKALHIAQIECRRGPWIAGFATGQVNGMLPVSRTELPLPQGTTVRLFLQPPPGAAAPPVPPEVPRVAVPNVVGMPEYTAVSLLSRLNPVRIGPAAAAGRTVLSQDPEAPTALPVGGKVELTMGLTIPELDDLNCDTARRHAAEFGHFSFVCEVLRADAPGQPVGRVIAQVPLASAAPVPGPVEIRVVVRGAAQVTVPDVSGLPLADASAALEAARLDPVPDAADGDRTVQRQRPGPASLVDVGSKVALWTVRMVVVPDVVGASPEVASRTLRAAGLRPDPDSKDPDDALAVWAQEPTAGTRVAQKSPVKLMTRLMVLVPDLVGRDCASAEAGLQGTDLMHNCADAGGRWRTWLEQPRIVTQSPAPGERAPVGTVIAVSQQPTTPGPLPWLAKRHPGAVVGGGIAALLLFGTVMGVRPWPKPAPPPPPVDVRWRIDPELAPAVQLHLAAADATRATATPTPPDWRLVPDDAPHALVRSLM